MFKMSIKNLIFSVLIFSFTSAFSQDNAIYSANKNQILKLNKTEVKSSDNTKNLFKDLSISINYGITQFDGDIRQYDYAPSKQTGNTYQDSDFEELRSAYSFSLEKKIDEKFSISIDYVNGEFAGLRRPNEFIGFEVYDPYLLSGTIGLNGEKFVTSFNEVDLLLNYDINSDLSKLIKTELPANLSIIAKIGFGYNSFRSLRTNLYTDEYMYGFGYEELTKNQIEEVTESVIVYGAKFKYELKDGLSLLVDYTVRSAMSDKWDSSIMDGGNGSDRFSLLSLGLAYDFTLNRAASKD